ncbi:MAG: AzlD domain-containing protein [Gammaproteobacteria bacterium]|nr:AzlD domain-containing protein [Gammaproteobacteria bacterium]
MKEWLLIGGMMAVTFIPRLLPMMLAGRFHIPPLLKEALEFVPIAVLTAIIAQAVFIHDGSFNLSASNPYIYGAVAATLTALLSKQLFRTILAGLVVYAIAFMLV